MPIPSISSSLSYNPFATSASSAYLVADLKNRIVTGDNNAFIAALKNAKAADISVDVEIKNDKKHITHVQITKKALSHRYSSSGNGRGSQDN